MENSKTGKGGASRIVENVLKRLEGRGRKRERLEKLAGELQLDREAMNQAFLVWSGIGLDEFLKNLSVSRNKAILDQSRIAREAGGGRSLEGSLRTSSVKMDVMTPRAYKAEGKRMTITFGYYGTPFGECLLAVAERGICALSFICDGRGNQEGLLKKKWHRSPFVRDDETFKSLVERIFELPGQGETQELEVLLRGTPFQISVWKALPGIGYGRLASYKDIAEEIGRPSSFRAVANAVAQNPVAYVVPCHRVIRESGVLNGYRWGKTKKKMVIGREAAWMESQKNRGRDDDENR